MSGDEQTASQNRQVGTNGGAYVEGNVHVRGGDFVGRDKVVNTRSDKEELTDYLARAVADYEARMYRLIAQASGLPDQPYKFLYAFELKDEDIFFGRDAAGEALHKVVLKDRLAVLHARSGAGKTSLLNAGLSPRLIREGRLPVHARAYDDPVLAIKQAIAPSSLGPWPELLSKLSLHEFLGLVCTRLSRQTQELVIILDQFEEFLIFYPEREHRQPFIHALADCYEDGALPVRFVIGIRDDYFGRLATFQDRLPHIFHNQFYLDAMSRQEAETAIVGPVSRLGRPVSYDQSLLDTLLDDLVRGGMELPHLQIICTQLYEALDEGETVIALAAYEELGRAEGVLAGYLKSVLDQLPDEGARIARDVLKELVSSEATRRVLGYDRLAARIEAPEDELVSVLARLVDARLLYRGETAVGATYEMAHEYLIREIGQWIDQADLAFKQAEELLAREVANRRIYGTLIPRDRLELLHAHREQLVGLEVETLECIWLSALRVGLAVEDWPELVGQVGGKMLLQALDDPRAETRRTAVEALKHVVNGRLGSQSTFWSLPYGEPVWVEIPAGEFWMGSEKGRDAEKPVRRVYLDRFHIARVPITNAQYQLFVEATEHGPPGHWKERRLPEGKESHPVVGVSWQDGMGYCEWLSKVTGKPITLPSEAQWEKAARGDTDDREYPWGQAWDATRCNTKELCWGETMPVGIFSDGASPYGCLDMAGNVWEWTRSLYKPYPYDSTDGRENPEAAGRGRRVLRGGSWLSARGRARCSYRYRSSPDREWNLIGFRVVVSPISEL